MTGKKTECISRAVSSRMPSLSSASSPAVRGQSSVEVMVYLGFFMLMFVSLSILFLSQVHQDISQREIQASQSIASQVAQNVDLALLAGIGFNATFPIPENINGRQYSLNFTNSSSLYVYIDQGPLSAPEVFYFPLSTRNIRLGCFDPDPLCPGNQQSTYTDVQGNLRQEWGVNASKGTLHIETVQDASGALLLEVS